MAANRPVSDRPREVPISKLLLDQSNARIGEYQADQAATQRALATLLDDQLFNLAKHILANGLDLSNAFMITPEGAPIGKYRVLEGNRRLIAIQAMAKPKILKDVLATARYRRLEKLSESFHANPIKKVWSVIYEAEEDAEHWIRLRHTGANNGIGLVGWNSNDQDRYKSRRGGSTNRKEAGQVLDFVDSFYPPNPDDNKRIFSTVQRIILTKRAKEVLGIGIRSRIVYSNFPASEVLKGLSKVVEDLRSGALKVSDVYLVSHSTVYLDGFAPDRVPDPSTKLAKPIPLASLITDDIDVPKDDTPGKVEGDVEAFNPAGPGDSTTSTNGKDEGDFDNDESDSASNAELASPTAPEKERKVRVKLPKPRPATIPDTCILHVTEPRINSIYHELIKIQVDDFTNACAVTLRVFVELTVDHHITANGLMTAHERSNTPLAKRLKLLAKFLHDAGRIDEQLEKAIIKVADGGGMMSASTTTFNQYVHNKFAYPQASELRTAWDELQPFMKALWVKAV